MNTLTPLGYIKVRLLFFLLTNQYLASTEFLHVTGYCQLLILGGKVPQR